MDSEAHGKTVWNALYSAPSQAGELAQAASPKWSIIKALNLLLMFFQNPRLYLAGIKHLTRSQIWLLCSLNHVHTYTVKTGAWFTTEENTHTPLKYPHQ